MVWIHFVQGALFAFDCADDAPGRWATGGERRKMCFAGKRWVSKNILYLHEYLNTYSTKPEIDDVASTTLWRARMMKSSWFIRWKTACSIWLLLPGQKPTSWYPPTNLEILRGPIGHAGRSGRILPESYFRWIFPVEVGNNGPHQSYNCPVEMRFIRSFCLVGESCCTF